MVTTKEKNIYVYDSFRVSMRNIIDFYNFKCYDQAQNCMDFSEKSNSFFAMHSLRVCGDFLF